MSTVADDYLQAYGEFSNVLRTWFVAYGIGAPVLLLTNEALSKALKQSGMAKYIAALFLIGVAIQVILAVANKFSMWALYYGETTQPYKSNRQYKIAYWFSGALWIDLMIDVATLVLFGLATWWIFRSVLING